jgi:transcriptional regulator with XRE-family HTH domain
MSGRHDQNLIGPRLRELRRKQRCTQQRLANQLRSLGCHQGTRSWVSKVEIRQIAVKDFHLPLLAKALGVHLSELLNSIESYAGELKKPRQC